MILRIAGTNPPGVIASIPIPVRPRNDQQVGECRITDLHGPERIGPASGQWRLSRTDPRSRTSGRLLPAPVAGVGAGMGVGQFPVCVLKNAVPGRPSGGPEGLRDVLSGSS